MLEKSGIEFLSKFLGFFRTIASKTLKEIQESYDLYLTHKLVVGRLKGHFASLNPQLQATPLHT